MSTRNLTALPTIADLERGMLALAALELILFDSDVDPDRGFFPKWDGTSTRVGVHDNGQGDHLFAVFDEAGCFMMGFAHESEMTPWRTKPPKIWPGLFDDIPEEFRGYLEEEAFQPDSATFVIWRAHSHPRWCTASIVDEFLPWDGSDDLLELATPNAELYREWAEENFEVEVELDAIESIVSLTPFDGTLYERFDCPKEFERVREELSGIGYP
ncbi:MAG: hypothetical protein AAF488_04520 [Planctomycetota bacterium]